MSNVVRKTIAECAYRAALDMGDNLKNMSWNWEKRLTQNV